MANAKLFFSWVDSRTFLLDFTHTRFNLDKGVLRTRHITGIEDVKVVATERDQKQLRIKLQSKGFADNSARIGELVNALRLSFQVDDSEVAFGGTGEINFGTPTTVPQEVWVRAWVK